jgi:hypothetical protein
MKTYKRPTTTRVRTTKRGGLNLDEKNRARYEVREQLQTLLETEDLPASARVTAARTLAEMEGLIGRHQAVPERINKPVSSLSRGELVSELERLRTLHGLGLVS